MSNKTIHPGYKTILKEVKPQLKGFETDITTIDKTMLTGYKGDFILGYRDNGTNLYRLESLSDACKWETENHKKSITLHHERNLAFLTNNQNFLFISCSGESRVISKSDAISFLETRRDEALDVADFFEKINLKQIAFELYTYIKYNGRKWKSRIREDWESCLATPALTRLRNHFEHSFLFKQKSIMLFDDEQILFAKLSLIYIRDKDEQ